MITHFVILLFFSCQTSLRSVYEKERTQSLNTITDIPQENWKPDIRLQISYKTLSNLTKEVVKDKVKNGTFPVQILGQNIDIKINSEIDSLTLSADQQDTIGFVIALEGKLELKHHLISFSNPYSATLKGSLKIDVQENALQIKANRIEDVDIETKYIPQFKINDSIKDWLNNNLKTLPSQEIMALNLSTLSARSLRFVGNRHSLDVEALSHFPDTTPLPDTTRRPRRDWEMQMSNNTISQLVRQKTFELPPINGFHMDIQHVSIDKKKLSSKLRIWKLDGWGQWWRDYDIQATIATQKNEILLSEPNAKQIAKSKGAGLADPIALLAEGIILEEITKQIQYTIPKEKKTTVSENNIVLTIEGIAGQKDIIHVYGTLDSDTKKDSKPKRRRRSK